ncbi:MAG: DUF3108 domain-containing protein [Burkholderiaceae bacterium]
MLDPAPAASVEPVPEPAAPPRTVKPSRPSPAPRPQRRADAAAQASANASAKLAVPAEPLPDPSPVTLPPPTPPASTPPASTLPTPPTPAPTPDSPALEPPVELPDHSDGSAPIATEPQSGAADRGNAADRSDATDRERPAQPAAPTPTASEPRPPPAAAGAGGANAADAESTNLLRAMKAAPQSGGVRYRIYYGDQSENNQVAEVDYLFELREGSYRLYTEGRASGLMAWFYRGALVQLSSGTLGAQGLTTQRYLEKRGERALRETSVDARSGEIVFDAGARASAPPGLQDRLSVLVQLSLLLQAQPERFAAGASIALPMLGSSSIDATPWRVLGDETVATPVGAVPAVRLSRRSADPRDPVVDVWLARDGRLFPVRLLAVDPSGRVLDQVVSAR